jgi:S1-C subfamily serine protease
MDDMKKVMILIMMLFLIGCQAKQIENKPLTISYAYEELYVGDVVKLETNIEKVSEDYKETDLTWTSSDDNIASVDDGVVIALKAGEVEIIASIGNYEAKKKFVINEKQERTILSIQGLNTVIVGETIQLEAIMNNQMDNTVTWLSEDPTIATVDQEGLVTAVKTGLVKIIAQSKFSSTLKSEHLLYVKAKDGIQDVIKNEIIHTIYELDGDFDLSYINNQTVTLVNNVREAVVGVSNYQYGKDIFGRPTKDLNRSSIGTGAIYQKQVNENDFTYTLITNHHVVENAAVVKIYLGYLDKEVEATVIKDSAILDLAIVTFTTEEDINPLSFSDEEFATSDFVVAIGNSYGYEYYGSVTFGIISEKERHLDGEEALFIQHTAAINPGNSGGPLFSLDGKIIGINTLKIASNEIDNMGFAISVKTVKEFIE